MAGLTVGIRVDDRAVRRLFEKAPQAAVHRMGQLIEGSAIDVQREEKQVAPVGVHGGSGLRGSIRYTLNLAKLQAVVEPHEPYAEPVEKGSRPHWTSAKPGTPLAQWARLKGINPYAVQRSIAKKGTKAHPYVKPTYEKMKPLVERNIVNGMLKFARDMNNGHL